MNCQNCGTEIGHSRNRKYCDNCRDAGRKQAQKKYREKTCAVDIPFTKEEIQDLIDKRYPIGSIAFRFQVSKSMIRKFVKKYGIKRSWEFCTGGIPVNCKSYHFF